MPNGTLSIKNGETALTGTDTEFTAEIKAGDYVVFTAGKVLYTLAVKSVESDTAATLVKAYTGPSVSGAGWSVVKQGTMATITMEVVAQVTEALRGLNLDKANWQQVFSVNDDITVTLPDGSTYTGPSWLKVANGINLSDLDKVMEVATQITADATAAEAAQAAAEKAAETAAADAKAQVADAVKEGAAEGVATAIADATTAAGKAETAQAAAEAALNELVDVKQLQVVASTLPAGSAATATFDAPTNTLQLGLPQGEAGEVEGFTFTPGTAGSTMAATAGGAVILGATCTLVTSNASELILDGAGGLTISQSGVNYKVYSEKNPPAALASALSASEVDELDNSTRKAYSLRVASEAIAPLQDAVDLGIATEEEKAQLEELKQHRVALHRLDLTLDNVEWPETPASLTAQ